MAVAGLQLVILTGSLCLGLFSLILWLKVCSSVSSAHGLRVLTKSGNAVVGSHWLAFLVLVSALNLRFVISDSILHSCFPSFVPSTDSVPYFNPPRTSRRLLSRREIDPG